MVNPDASRSFVGRASGEHVPHGSPDRGGSPGSSGWRHAEPDAGLPAHSRRHSKSGRGRSSCRRVPAPGSERTGTAGPALPPPPPGRGMDAVCNGWNNAPACVLGTVWGTASNPAWQFRSAPCLPIGRLSSRHCAPTPALAPATEHASQAGLWICGQRKGVAHMPTAPTADTKAFKEVD